MLSQTDVVVAGIKEMITGGRLVPGARLPVEKDLAAELGVSRGSLREAVRALAMMGVLETRQGDGTYVTSLDPGLLLAPMELVVELQSPDAGLNLQSVRRVLEAEAAFRAASLIDDTALAEAESILARLDGPLLGDAVGHESVMEADIAFHRVIARACGNPVLESLINALAGRTVRDRLWRAITEEGIERVAHAEHRAILAALREHDADGARIRMAAHLYAVEDFLQARSVGAPASVAADPDGSPRA